MKTMTIDSPPRRRAAAWALASSGAFACSGCGLLAMGVVSSATPAAHRLQLAGAEFPAALFKAAAVQAGGVVTVHTAEYMRAELREAAVTLELQQLRPGEYQLVGTVLRTSALPRLPSFSDKVQQETRKVADQLAAAGYRIVEEAVAKRA